MEDVQQCLENLIPEIEPFSFQNIGVQKALLNKKMLLAFDTGTGKTFTYALFVRALLNRNPEKKHIFVIIHDSLDQAVKDLRNLVAAPVQAFSGAAGEFGRMSRMWNRTSIIALTYECFRDMDMVLFLYNHLLELESFVIDEAHHAANWDDSDTAFMIRAICKFIPYIVELTATPITSVKAQYFQLLNIADRKLSPRRDETEFGKYEERYFPVDRSEYEIKGSYKPILEVVEPQPNQIGKIHGIVSRVIKGTGAVNQVQALVRLLKKYIVQQKKVIVYVNYHDTRCWVESHLETSGISFVSLHGKVLKMEDRKDILACFADGDVQVLVTSVAESLNIDSDVVVFYEFTTKLKQVMGRAHRGLSGKELDLVFVLTRNTAEVDYFMKYVYDRSLTIQRLLRKDYSEFIAIGNQIKEMDLGIQEYD